MITMAAFMLLAFGVMSGSTVSFERVRMGGTSRWNRDSVIPTGMYVMLATAMLISACGGEALDQDSQIVPDSSVSADAADTTHSETDGAIPSMEDALGVGDTSAGNGADEVPSDSWATAAVQSDQMSRPLANVANLRVGSHDGYDRVVVEFEGSQLPGYLVHYLDRPPSECGSGRTLDFGGGESLAIRLEPARGFTESGSPTVDHARRVFTFKSLAGMEVSCDFEAVFTIALSMSRRLAFRVNELENPPRLVVDVRHPAF